ncbi:MAG: YceD family protein [Solirubrobacteraceae bacterium]
MRAGTDSFDLSALRLRSGEGRRLELSVAIDPLRLGSYSYPVAGAAVPVELRVSRTTGQGYALALRFEVTLTGPCMRCLEPAAPGFGVQAREVWQPRGGEDLESPYVQDGALELRGWARDALVLALPPVLLCRPDCAGLCPVCGVDLNSAGPEHGRAAPPDPRWAKLSELRLDR